MTFRDVSQGVGGAPCDRSYKTSPGAPIDVGEIVVLSGGIAQAATTATDLVAVGICVRRPSNVVGGVDGGGNVATEVLVRSGVDFGVLNSASDPVTQSNVGSNCYLVDSGTVAATDGGGTRSAAGRVVRVVAAPVDANGSPTYEDAARVYVEIGRTA